MTMFSSDVLPLSSFFPWCILFCAVASGDVEMGVRGGATVDDGVVMINGE